jgi:hypothetical protein
LSWQSLHRWWVQLSLTVGAAAELALAVLGRVVVQQRVVQQPAGEVVMEAVLGKAVALVVSLVPLATVMRTRAAT